jgi:hypothetical protein
LKLAFVDSIGCALLLMAVAFELWGCYSSSSNLALKTIAEQEDFLWLHEV